jgi:hypothetical protein
VAALVWRSWNSPKSLGGRGIVRSAAALEKSDSFLYNSTDTYHTPKNLLKRNTSIKRHAFKTSQHCA